MKRVFSLVTMILIICLSLCSCKFDLSGFDIDADKKTVVYYGVGSYVGELGHTCLYIPSVGHMTMPGNKSGEKVPDYSVGDLVKITFVEKNGDIPIMESFPGQFGAKAEQISVKEGDIGYSVTEEGSLFSDNIPDGVSIGIGEELIFSVSVDGKTKDIAEGTVTDTSDGRYTVLLESFGSDKDFFGFIFENDLIVNKK